MKKLDLEQCRLNLIRDGKVAAEGLVGDDHTVSLGATASSRAFNVAGNLCLVPKF
uniref:Uncharacterized protein n=1 Tax=Anguilla anguilla TaxID=7936 RepID=A0A0E9TWK8_ANGAN